MWHFGDRTRVACGPSLFPSVTGNSSLLLLPLNDPEKLSCKAADPHTGRQVV